MSNPQPFNYTKQFSIIDQEGHNGKSQHAGSDSVSFGMFSLALQIPNLSQCTPISRSYRVCGCLYSDQDPGAKAKTLAQESCNYPGRSTEGKELRGESAITC